MTPGAWAVLSWLATGVVSVVGVVVALVRGEAFAAVAWAVAFLAASGAMVGMAMYESLRRETGYGPNPTPPWVDARHRDGTGPTR